MLSGGAYYYNKNKNIKLSISNKNNLKKEEDKEIFTENKSQTQKPTGIIVQTKNNLENEKNVQNNKMLKEATAKKITNKKREI